MLANLSEKVLLEIKEHRQRIVEEYLKAWCSSLPAENIDANWLMQNIELVEHSENNMVRWYVRMKQCDHSEETDLEHTLQ